MADDAETQAQKIMNALQSSIQAIHDSGVPIEIALPSVISMLGDAYGVETCCTHSTVEIEESSALSSGFSDNFTVH